MLWTQEWCYANGLSDGEMFEIEGGRMNSETIFDPVAIPENVFVGDDSRHFDIALSVRKAIQIAGASEIALRIDFPFGSNDARTTGRGNVPFNGVRYAEHFSSSENSCSVYLEVLRGRVTAIFENSHDGPFYGVGNFTPVVDKLNLIDDNKRTLRLREVSIIKIGLDAVDDDKSERQNPKDYGCFRRSAWPFIFLIIIPFFFYFASKRIKTASDNCETFCYLTFLLSVIMIIVYGLIHGDFIPSFMLGQPECRGLLSLS